jgi:hypothetical protein
MICIAAIRVIRIAAMQSCIGCKNTAESFFVHWFPTPLHNPRSHTCAYVTNLCGECAVNKVIRNITPPKTYKCQKTSVLDTFNHKRRRSLTTYKALEKYGKGKAIPLQAWAGRRLRLPYFNTIGT